MRIPVAGSQKTDYEQLRAIIEADSLTTTQEFSQELNVDHPIVIWHQLNCKSEKV